MLTDLLVDAEELRIDALLILDDAVGQEARDAARSLLLRPQSRVLVLALLGLRSGLLRLLLVGLRRARLAPHLDDALGTRGVDDKDEGRTEGGRTLLDAHRQPQAFAGQELLREHQPERASPEVHEREALCTFEHGLRRLEGGVELERGGHARAAGP